MIKKIAAFLLIMSFCSTLLLSEGGITLSYKSDVVEYSENNYEMTSSQIGIGVNLWPDDFGIGFAFGFYVPYDIHRQDNQIDLKALSLDTMLTIGTEVDLGIISIYTGFGLHADGQVSATSETVYGIGKGGLGMNVYCMLPWLHIGITGGFYYDMFGFEVSNIEGVNDTSKIDGSTGFMIGVTYIF